MCLVLYNVSSLPGNGNLIQCNGMKMVICIVCMSNKPIWKTIICTSARTRTYKHNCVSVYCMLQGNLMLHCLNDIQLEFSIATIEGFIHAALSQFVQPGWSGSEKFADYVTRINMVLKLNWNCEQRVFSKPFENFILGLLKFSKRKFIWT